MARHILPALGSEACDNDHPDDAACGNQGKGHVFPASAGQDVLDQVVKAIAFHVTFVTQSPSIQCGLCILGTQHGQSATRLSSSFPSPVRQLARAQKALHVGQLMPEMAAWKPMPDPSQSAALAHSPSAEITLATGTGRTGPGRPYR